MLKATGRTVWQWDNQEPFGLSGVQDDPDGDGRRFELNLRFPGQTLDAETGLHHNQARDYDAATGRYIQSDPIRLDGGISTYLYAAGNPIGLSDPLGLAPKDPASVLPKGLGAGGGGWGRGGLGGGAGEACRPGDAAKVAANFSRELKATDLGVKGTVQELRGTFAVKDGVATMRVDMIRGEVQNPLQVVGNMAEAAKAGGATTLRIKGTIANERLYNVLNKRYGLTSSGATDSITIPLK